EAGLERERRQRIEVERKQMERGGSTDPALWHTTVDAIKSNTENMLVMLREQLARRDAELSEVRRDMSARPPSSDMEGLKLLERRAQDDSVRMSETHRRELEAERREHEQTVAMIERLHRSEIENLKASHMQALAGKDREIARLEEEVREARETGRPQDAVAE